ncbi:MAG: hypothetical protein ACM3U0_00210 [archaeon]
MLKHWIPSLNFAILIAFTFFYSGCKDNPAEGGLFSNYQIVYHKWINNNWEIYLNSSDGNTPKNISNFSYEDSDCMWSPDGKAVAYTHMVNRAADIYLYNIKTNENINLTPDETYDAQTPAFSPDGKSILFSYLKIPDLPGTYIMKSDGSDKKKLLDYEAKIYFYKDSYNFLYQPAAVFDEKENYIYMTNTDRTYNEQILDLRTLAQDYATVFDFNPHENKLLILASDTLNKPNFIITFDAASKTIDTLIKASEGHTFSTLRYSHDFTKIALYEHSDDYKTMRLCLYDVKTKLLKYLVEIPSTEGLLNFRPPEFSPDDRYLSYVKSINQSGGGHSGKSNLYTIELSTGKIQYIDEADDPHWNPVGGLNLFYRKVIDS